MSNVSSSRGKALFLIIVSLVGMALSSLYLYQVHLIPIRERRTTVLAGYYHDISYDYLIFLKPNNVYNVSVLRPKENFVYRRITDFIDFNMSYTFVLSVKGEGSIRYIVNMTLESSAGWEKGLGNITSGEVPFNGTECRLFESFRVYPNAFWDLIEAIEKETGTISSEYRIKIEPKIYVHVNTAVGVIDEEYSPIMMIKIKESDKRGDIITIEGDKDSRYGEINRTDVITRDYLMFQRYFSYFLVGILGCGVAYSSFAFVKTKPEVKPMEVSLNPLKDVLANIDGEPINKEGYTIVKVTALEDLVKISDNLLKPILMAKREEAPRGEKVFTLYVIDGAIRYEYEVREKL